MKIIAPLIPPSHFCTTLLWLSLAGLCLSGCASRMALDEHKKSLANLKTPIGIFTLEMENASKPSLRPAVNKVTVDSRSGGRGGSFTPNRPYKEHGGLEYLMSVGLSPGDYTLGEVQGGASIPMLIQGHFAFRADTRFNLSSGLVYLGHVKMTNRPRQGSEKRSGGMIPLIDQAVCGFSTGTFDVTVTDRSATDIPDFLAAYPLLQGVPIAKSIMQK